MRIGDRCLIGKGSGIVGHLSVDIGDDVWTGHFVYITDQNHGYEDTTRPISRQSQPERPVVIGDGSWLGHGTVVLPGARIGRHVAVAAGSVVTGDLPDLCVAAGAPGPPDPPLRRRRRLAQGLRAATPALQRRPRQEFERFPLVSMPGSQPQPMSSGTMQLGMALVLANSSIRSVTGAPPCSFTLKGSVDARPHPVGLVAAALEVAVPVGQPESHALAARRRRSARWPAGR